MDTNQQFVSDRKTADEDQQQQQQQQQQQSGATDSNCKPEVLDPAILSRGPVQVENRIRYSRAILVALRDSKLSSKRPTCIDIVSLPRNIWRRDSVADDTIRRGRNNSGSGGGAGGSGGGGGPLNSGGNGGNASGGPSGSGANSDYSGGGSGGGGSGSSSYLLPLFAVKRRTTDVKGLRKNELEPMSSGQQQRRMVFNCGPPSGSGGGGGNGGGNSSSNVLASLNDRERRIGSGRIVTRDSSGWDYRSAADKELPSESDYNFRPGGGLLGLRDRDRNNDPQQQQQQQQPQSSSNNQQSTNQSQRISIDTQRDRDRDRGERDRDYRDRDDRYERRSYGREYDRDKDRGGNRNMSGGNLMTNRFVCQTNNNNHGSSMDRRRMYNENRAEEPEWFSGGPTSQHDIIELRGFDEPELESPQQSAKKSNDPPNTNNNSSNPKVDQQDTDDGGNTTISTATSQGATSPPARSTPTKLSDTNNNNNNNNNSSSGLKNDDQKPVGDSQKFDEVRHNAGDDFNFEDFLKMDSISELLATNETYKDSSGTGAGGAGESRFSRWFKAESPDDSKSRRSSLQDDLNNIIGNPNIVIPRDGTTGGDKYFAPISPAASTGSTNSLLEFLQRGKFTTKPPAEANAASGGGGPAQTEAAIGHMNTQAQAAGQIHSVEELEARMRIGGVKNQAQQQIRNRQQQDLLAFKKLLAQMSSGEGAGQIHPQQQHPNAQQQQAAANLMQIINKNVQHPPPLEDYKKMFPMMMNQQQQQQAQQQQRPAAMNNLQQQHLLHQQPPPPLHSHMQVQQQQQQQQQAARQQQQQEAIQKVIQIGQQIHQSRLEILNRPEAHNLIQGITHGEITQKTLLQHLANPTLNQRQREIIVAVLNLYNGTSRVSSPNILATVVQPPPPLPTNQPPPPPLQQQQPVPPNQQQASGGNTVGPVSGPPPPQLLPNPSSGPPGGVTGAQPPQPPTTGDTIQSHLLFQHHQAQAQAQKQQLRVSPLPNAFVSPVMANSPITLHIPGIPQRIPSPRELQFHTQSIMQNALIKKKLEEQRENYRKRQEMQQQQAASNVVVVDGGGGGNAGDRPTIVKSAQQTQSRDQQQPGAQTQQQSVQPTQQQPPPPHQTQSQGSGPPTVTAPVTASPAKQHAIASSPTPLAFTPTSVLRKMTAEKEIDMLNNITNKDLIKPVTVNQQLQQQYQQQQTRLLFNQLSQQQQQQQQHVQAQAVQQNSQQQQQQQQQQIRNNAMKWNQFNQIVQPKPMGRPIVKGGMPMQFASSIEYQQMQQQYQQRKPPPPGVSLGGMQPPGGSMGGPGGGAQQPIVGSGGGGGGGAGGGPPSILQQQQQQQQQQVVPPQQPGLNQQQLAQLLQHRQQQQQQHQQQRVAAMRSFQVQQYQQIMHQHQQHQQQQNQPPNPSNNATNNNPNVANIVPTLNENHGMINFNRDGGLSPTSNQLARWFSPELLAQASAGKLPSLNIGQALSLEEFERTMQHSSSATVHN